jgi:hypothetical protein
MWTWNEDKTGATIVYEDGSCQYCGVNIDPLQSWIAEGNEPEPYVPLEESN